MAKRFFDTDFYKNPFVRSLKGPYKALYSFIITDASHCGIWFPDFEAAVMYTDQKITEDGARKAFDGKFVELPNGKWFFPDLVKQQQPNGLSDTNRAHGPIIEKLNGYGFLNEDLTIKEIKDLVSPSQGGKVTVKVTVMDKVKVKEDRRKIFYDTVVQVNCNWNSKDLIHEPILTDKLLNDPAKGFIPYWTESGSKDKKMRFEKERSFDIKRRLLTWLGNSKKYGNDKGNSGGWDGIVGG